jgi:hypothetical protein
VRWCCSGSADLAGGRVTWPRPGLGPGLSCLVLVSFFSEFHDFCDRTSFRHHGISPPHLLPIYLHAQQGGDKNTYLEKIESVENNNGNQFH